MTVSSPSRFRLGLLLSWPTLVLAGLGAVPFVLLLRISLGQRDPNGIYLPSITLQSYGALGEPELLGSLLDSIRLAVIVGAISVGLGFPLTWLVTRMRRRLQVAWLIFLLATLSLSDVLIAFSWQVMLSKRIGLSNLFVTLGLMDAPESLTPSGGAVVACLVYLVIPFTVLTLFPVLSRLDRDLIEAARTLGASPLRAFLSVVVPMTKGPAMIAFVMAMVLTVGAYVPPLVLGRPQSWPMAVLIGSTALAGHDLPRASAMSVFLLAATVLLAFGAFLAARVESRKIVIKGAGKILFLTVLGIFLAAPLVVVAGVSFNGTQRMNFPPQNAGLLWYRTFFDDPAWMSALSLSLIVAALAALASVSIAFPISYAIWKYRSRMALFLESLARISFLLPSIVLSIVFLVFWSWIGHVGRIEDTILSHAVVFVALPLATIGMGFRSIDMALVEAARTMGARESDVLRTVIRPIVLPYVVSGLVFVFILSLNEYIIAYMVAGFEVETLPIKVFNNLRMGFQPTMCVGAVLFMLLGVFAFSAVAAIGDLPKLLGGVSRR